MKIGDIIKKYRKELGLTQEEMALRLGVTAPAVNKWERGGSMPDITLLKPLARLLGISTDELLAFESEPTEEELRSIMSEADRRFRTDSFDEAFKWAKKQVETYPQSMALTHGMAVLMDSVRLLRAPEDSERYDEYILSCYERLLKSDDEAMRDAAADALFRYFLLKEQYEKAGAYLEHFSRQNPERRRKLALLAEKSGDAAGAQKAYEELLFTECRSLQQTLYALIRMALEDSADDRCSERSGETADAERDEAGEKTVRALDRAEYLAAKCRDLARIFEFGEYNEHAAMLEVLQAKKDIEGTLDCVCGLLGSVGTLSDFSKSPLYAHMDFKSEAMTDDFAKQVREDLLESFREGDGFEYMEGDAGWRELLGGASF